LTGFLSLIVAQQKFVSSVYDGLKQAVSLDWVFKT